MPRDFSAKQIRVSQLIASGGNGTNAGLLIYSASDGTNYTGGFPAALTSGIGPDVFLFVSGTEDGKARGEGVTLFGGDVVISGTMYAEKSIIEVDVSSTGSVAISGSLVVSQSATINEGLTVNNSGESGPENDFTLKGSSNTTLLFGDVSTNRIGIGVADPDSTLEVFSTSTQLKLSNNSSDFATFAVGTDGDLTVTTVDAAAGGADFVVVADGAVDIDANQGTLSLDGSAGINIGTESDVAIDIDSSTLDIDASGAVTIDVSGATISLDAGDSSNFTTSAGSLTLEGKTGVTIKEDGTGIITIDDDRDVDIQNARNIDIDASGAVTIDSSGGQIDIGTANNNQNIRIGTDGTRTIQIGAGDGTTTTTVNSRAGTLTLDGTGQTVDINSANFDVDASGTVTIDGVGASNVTTHGVLTLSGSDGLNIASDEGEIDLTSRQGAIDVNAGAALSLDGASGINIGTAANVAVDLNSSTLDIDATGALTIDSATSIAIGANADKPIDIDSTTLDIDASGAVTIDSTSTFSIDGVGASNITSVGVLTLSGSTQTLVASEAEADTAVKIFAAGTAGGIDVDSGTGGYQNTTTGRLHLTSSMNTGDGHAIQLLASAGGIQIDATGAAGEDITIKNTGGSVSISATETSADAIKVDSSGGIDITSAGAHPIDIESTNAAGHILLKTAHTAGVAVHIDADANAGSIVDIDAGILQIDATGVAGINSGGTLSLGTANSGVAVNIGHGTSEVTVGDNLTVTGNSTIAGNLGVNGIITGSLGLSGSLTRLVDGKSFIEAGANITVTSASNGAITIVGAGGSAAGSDTQVQYNDGGSSFGAITNLTTDGTDVTLLDAGKLKIGTGGDLVISSSNDQVYFGLNTANKDLIFMSNDAEVMRIDESANSLAIGVNANTVSKLKVHVTNGDNVDGIEIVNEDAGQKAIDIDSEGAGIEINGKECLTVTVDENAGYGAIFTRNKAAADVADPLVKIRDQDGDQQALRVLAESLNPAAFAIAVGNAAGVKTTISGSGQMGIGMGTNPYLATLHVRSHIAGAGIELEQQGGGDTVARIYDSADDGIIDVYANNAVTSRIHGNGLSFIGGSLQVTGSELDVAEYIRHLGDNDTYIQFGDDAIRFNVGGKELANFNEDESTIAFNNDNDAINTLIKTDTKLAFAAGTPLGAGKDQVLIMSGGAASSFNEAAGHDVLLYVSGSPGSIGTTNRATSVFGGDVLITGSLRARQPLFTTHKMTPGNNTAAFVRFDTIGSDASAGLNNKMIAPYLGTLLSVSARGTSAPGSTVIGLHTNTNTNTNLNGTSTEDITVNMSAADTSYTFAYTLAAGFGPGDIIGLKINPASDPGTMIITAVWEFQTYG